jgi:hypothetical protein
MTNPWILLLSAAVGLLSGLFSGLLGRRLEEWWYQPKLVLEFDPDERGFRTEGKWKEGDTEVVEIYIRDRVRNVGRGRIATQCRPYLVNLEEVHSAGTTATSFVDSLVLRCRDQPKIIIQEIYLKGSINSSMLWAYSRTDRAGGLRLENVSVSMPSFLTM